MYSNKRARLDHSTNNFDADSQPVPRPHPTRACAECKKHKIKCFVQPGETVCSKCRKSGIECIPHNFAQKFLDEDKAWKAHTSTSIERLEKAVDHLLHVKNLQGLANHDGATPSSNTPLEQVAGRPAQTVLTLPSDRSHSRGQFARDFTPEGPSKTLLDGHDESDLVPLPMNNLYHLADPENSHLMRVDPVDANGPDFIERGVLSEREAEYLFDYFRDHINPSLWDGILCSHKSLHEARQASSLLVAVVLTVAALHIPGHEKTLHATYQAFVSMMRGSCLLRCQNLDVIRALCIGAFYLTSLSWALCSRAVRLATELNLHKSSIRFARGCIESYERVRLWYVLYICDHQFALAYGRPPMMHEDSAIRHAEKLLSSGLSSKADQELVAQVKLFGILANSYFLYGCDPDLELAGQDFESLRESNIFLDQWHLAHQRKITATPKGSDQHQSRVNTLYYHLARFHLNSVALRGISARGSPRNGSSLSMGWERQEAANIAISAASSSARLISDDADLQKALIGSPIFVHAMVAICASFLLKMAVAFCEPASSKSHLLHLPRDLAQYGLNFHTRNALTIVKRLLSVLSQVVDMASQRHVIRQVVVGLGELLQRFSIGQDADHWDYSLSRIKDTACVSSSGSKSPAFHTTAQDGPSGAAPTEIDALNSQINSEWLTRMMDPQQDFSDLTGDLDWRFDSSFVFGIDTHDPDLPFL